jgi:2-oxoglutarate dehydrogenase E1 component
MAHRGRLHLLCAILNKPVENVLTECATREHQRHLDIGDAKYIILGTTSELAFADNNKIQLTLLANPSHLEAIAPVVLLRSIGSNHMVSPTGPR